MGRGEISWKGRAEDGTKREIYVKHVGDRWVFHIREKRYDCWEILDSPSLDDWLELLDGVRRRVGRRLMRPEEEERVKKIIAEKFPDAAL